MNSLRLRLLNLVFLMAFVLLASACGQKGPLQKPYAYHNLVFIEDFI